MIRRFIPLLLLTSALTIATPAARAQTPEIPDAQYVQVKDGHLSLEGRRVRYWGFIGYARSYDKITAKRATEDAATRAANLKKARANLDLMVNRIDLMGFNLIRNWDGGALVQGEGPAQFEMGDGSPADLRAYYLWKLDQRGIKVWESSFTTLGDVSAQDVGAIDDVATASAWRAALEASGPMRLRENVARAWDERISALAVRRMKRTTDFRNPYKDNLRWGDDPQVVTWEITNEEIWIRRMLKGDWQKLPMFFQAHLTRSGCGRVVSSVNTIRFWLRRSHVQDFSSRISRSQHPTTTRPRKVSFKIRYALNGTTF